MGRARHSAAPAGDQQNIARNRAQSRQVLGIQARPLSADIVPKRLRDSQSQLSGLAEFHGHRTERGTPLPSEANVISGFGPRVDTDQLAYYSDRWPKMANKRTNPEDSPLGEWLACSMLIASFIALAIGSALVH